MTIPWNSFYKVCKNPENLAWEANQKNSMYTGDFVRQKYLWNASKRIRWGAIRLCSGRFLPLHFCGRENCVPNTSHSRSRPITTKLIFLEKWLNELFQNPRDWIQRVVTDGVSRIDIKICGGEIRNRTEKSCLPEKDANESRSIKSFDR